MLSTPNAAHPRLLSILAAVACTGIGAVVRAFGATRGGFPLNDGGLFYQMVLDLRGAWPFLPDTTFYNGAEVPFAYPPLGFYLGAAFHDVAGGIDVMRMIPLALSCLTVPALFLLARAISGGILVPTAASLAYALMPRSFEWLVMGGGLTRSLGVLLAILAAWLTWRLIERPTAGAALLAGLVGGLTVLAHPQATLLALSGVLIFAGARARSRSTFAFLGLAGLTALVVITPWVLAVVLRHGFDPFLAAGGTQPGIGVGALNLLALDFSGSRISPVLGVMAVLGMVLALLQGRWVLPAWFAAVMLLDSRGGAVYAMVPAAILAGEAIVRIILVPFWRPDPPPLSPFRFLRSRLPSTALLTFILIAGIVDAMGSQLAPDWPAVAISEDQLQGMRWVRNDGPPDAEYLVVTGRPWASDAVAEWFPVITDARSVSTVQGTEWLGAGAFNRALGWSEDLMDCATQTATCLEAWSEEHGVGFTHVYLPKGSVSGPLGSPDCCTALRETLASSEAYHVVHDDAAATVFAVVDR